MRKIVIGQAGGPTTVLNTSLYGFLDNTPDYEIYGAIKGFQGLVEGDLLKLEGDVLETIKNYRDVPGACLGAGRYHLSDEDLNKIIQSLKEQGIDAIVFIGGDGTMWTLHQLYVAAKQKGYDLQVIGIPKTVDNDLPLTDHAPGFGSAARYVATTVRDISKDLESMRNFEQVRIIETMGRNAGWLAASSGYLKKNDMDGPHKIYVPEKSLTSGRFLQDVQLIVEEIGFATIVVSEGVKLDDQPAVRKAVVGGRQVLGGIAKQLSQLVKSELDYIARDELLGMSQRSNQLIRSSQDRLEAYEVGKEAAYYLRDLSTNVMVSIRRNDTRNYSYQLKRVPLNQVAKGGERILDKRFIDDPNRFYHWLAPLIGDGIESYPQMIQKRINEQQSS